MISTGFQVRFHKKMNGQFTRLGRRNTVGVLVTKLLVVPKLEILSLVRDRKVVESVAP